MNILVLTTDKKILEQGTSAWKRMEEYRKLFPNLEVLLVSKLNFLKSFFYKTKNKPDLVTSQDPFELGFLAWRLAKKFNAKLELQIHTDLFSPFFEKESFRNWFDIKLAKFLLPKANQIRVVSKRIKNDLVGILNISEDKMKVLPVWVNVEKFKNDGSSKRDGILVVSRLTHEKNVASSLYAVKDLNAKLTIVGEGPEKKKLENLAKKLGISDRVRFVGWQNDLVPFYQEAETLLLTSNYDGFGMVLVEAAASGCKIISTDVGVAEEVTDAVCPVGNIECLAEKLKEGAGNSRLPSEFSLTKEEYLKRFKELWENVS